tara:strand:+ start:3882 stop:4358 length:477 start_codon:yes stop_codon:yes gene_type:complete
MSYYQTPGGLFYKQCAGGQCRRIPRLEFFQKAGAKDVVAAAASQPDINYTKKEQQCIDWAQERVEVNKAENMDKFKMTNKKGKEFNNIGWLVATSYEEAGVAHPECQDFFAREKLRKTAAKEARRASKKKRRSRKRKSRRKSRSKSRSKKRSKSKSKK